MAAFDGQDPVASADATPFSVGGTIDFENFPVLRAEGERYIASAPRAVFSLADLSGGGSTAVALLMAWFRHAHQSDKTVAFEDVPESLLNIIEVSGLANVLPVRALAGAAEDPTGSPAPPDTDRA